MTKKDKIDALDETQRDIDREISRINEKLENEVEKMTNPAQSQKEFKDIITELEERKVKIGQIKKDIIELDVIKENFKDLPEKIKKLTSKQENSGAEETSPKESEKKESKQ